MTARRQGRGRLSSIDLLPAEASDIVAWAYDELRQRERTQLDIHAEFNERLAAIGAGPISLSAFNRHSLRLAAMARRHEEIRTFSNALVERLDPDDADQVTIAAAETLKVLVYELSENPNTTPKQALDLARALTAAEAASKSPQARKRERQKQFADQVDAALTRATTEKGLSGDMAASLRKELLGVRS